MATERDDDYLICREYQERISQRSAEYPDFITFQHPNGNHYFAWVAGDDIILRSEAYPDAEKMERGIKAILKNRDLFERYSVDTQHGVHFLVLWGGGDHQVHTGNMEKHNEIGRSCPKKNKEEIYALLSIAKGDDFAGKIVKDFGIAATIASTFASTTSAVADEVIHKNTITEEVSHTSSERSSTYVETPKVVTSSTTHTVSSDNGDSGLGWLKWLLPLLLALGLLWMWKGCNKKDMATSSSTTIVDTTIVNTPAATDTQAKSSANVATTPPPPPTTPDCNLNWILFDFDKFDIRSDAQSELKTMAEILKANPDYVGDLSAHTDAKGTNEYNDQLSKNRANAAKRALIGMGIDASRLSTSASSEAAPIATNTDDDTGRKFNRRVELRIKDKSGKEICKSIPPNVPSSLKSN
ncbi:MAG: hypothetical protein RLZZ546_1908 [Bacteroidota bacterium]